MTNEDWKIIAEKVSQYAIMSDGQQYSVFIFTLYADYIDASADWLTGRSADEAAVKAMHESGACIKELAASIRYNTEQLQAGALSEVDYIEGCMWISLEAMIKLLSSFFTMKIPKEYADLILAASQLAFEYGRYVLYAKEQAILEKYIRNQYVLDEQLRREYEEYLKEVQFQAEKLQELVEDAFSVDIRQFLEQSAALAREAGVKEEELLQSVDDVDAFFMD